MTKGPGFAVAVFVGCVIVGGSLEVSDHANDVNQQIQQRRDIPPAPKQTDAPATVAYWDSTTGYVEYGTLPLPGSDVPLDKWGPDQPLANAIASDHAEDVCAAHTDDPVLNKVRSQYLSLTMNGVDCDTELIPPMTLVAP